MRGGIVDIEIEFHRGGREGNRDIDLSPPRKTASAFYDPTEFG